MNISAAVILPAGLAVLVLAALYIRFSTANPKKWHRRLTPPKEPMGRKSAGMVQRLNGARVLVVSPKGKEKQDLGQLNRLLLSRPRTKTFAGSVDEGHITWITRTAFWGFPDFTTAQIVEGGVILDSRLRFGIWDFGVNAQRLCQLIARKDMKQPG